MRKIAISLPDDQADAVERIRRRRGVPRSHVISEAIGTYLSEEARREAVAEYVEGYRRRPETNEAEAYVSAIVDGMDDEDWS